MAAQESKTSLNGNTTVKDLSAQIDLLKKDIAGLTETIADLGKAKSAEAQGKARDKVDELTETGKEKLLETQLQAEHFLKTQPGTALGIAAGIGFLVGLVTARR